MNDRNTLLEASRPKPLLAQSPLYKDYFRSLREGRVVVRRCEACGNLQWPPRELCRICHSEKFGVADVPMVGEVYTFSVMHRAFAHWYADKLPYGVAVVEVADGIRLLGGYVGDVAGLQCGARVEAVIEPVDDDVAVLLWRPAGG